jgi:CRP/FNR family transcriptional regulator
MTDSITDAQTPEPRPLLSAIDGATRARLLGSAARRTYEPNEIVFLQDEPCAGLFMVVSGLLKIAKVSSEGREQVLRHVSAGGSFNEVAVLDGGANPATVTAVERSELLVVSRDSMLALIAETPGLAETMIQALAGRLRHMVELVEDLSFRHVSERVARVLLQSVAPHPGVGAGADMSRRVSQREIAEMAGTSREVVARALKTIEASGAIAIDGGEIRLVDAAKLSALQ